MTAKTLLLLCCAGVLFSSGCARTQRRAPVDIIKERQRLATLFFTDKTNQRVIAPGDNLMIVDPKTKELAWPVHECANPDCPGRKDGAPFLFIHPLDLGYFVKDDGTIGFDAAKSGATPQYRGCPQCLKIRQLTKETPAKQALYNSYDKLYELPETAARRAKLDEELKQAMQPEPDKK